MKAAALHAGQVLWTARSSSYTRPNPEQLAGALRQACERLTGVVGRVGICVPGLLDEAKEQITYAANLPGLSGLRLRDLVSSVTGPDRPAPLVVNDANATAFDLHSTRRPSGRLLVLAIGTGVGASVLDDGKPLFVEGESPGHIGQIDISLEGEVVHGGDGGLGGLEGYIGASALQARYGADAASKIKPADPAFRAIARTIRICHALYRPHHICLAGGTGIRVGPLLAELRVAIEVGLTSLARPGWTLSCGDSDFHAAIGAARIAASSDWPR